MTPELEVDYILHDCFFAVGQLVGPACVLEPEAMAWWRDRYRARFTDAMVKQGNSWSRDRQRVTEVGRMLGRYAVHHANGSRVIDLSAATRASEDVERGCQMNARREAGLGLPRRHAPLVG